MKILVFMPYYPPHIGGVEFYAEEMHSYLAKNNNITIFTPRLPKNSTEKENIKKGKIKIIRFPAFEIVANYPLPKFWTLKFWRLFFSLYKQNFDIVISHTRFFNTSLLALIYSKITKTKWVHIEHGSDFVKLSSEITNFIAKMYDYTFGKLIFKQSNLNIPISNAVKKFILKFDKRRLPVIYRGVDLNEISKIPTGNIREQYPGKIIITFVGRLFKWKGVDKSVQAIKLLPLSIRQKIIFLIVGNGEDFAKIKNITKNEPSIKMIGEVSRNEAIGILKASHIYIHSAYPGGGLSTSLLETMSCKNAIIATPNEGAKEVIQNNCNGYLIKNNNPDLIKKKIIDLINDPAKIKKFGDNAYKHIKENFSWEESIKKYEKEFKKLLNQK